MVPRPRRPCRRSVLLTAFATSLAFAGLALSVGTTVALGPKGPSPAATTVGWGDTVVFTNSDSVAHGITSSKDELNAESIPPGGTFSAVMTGRTATYNYRQTQAKGRSIQASVSLNVVGSVSLKVSKTGVVYGQSFKLSGTTSLHGTPVLLQRRTHGQTVWTTLEKLTSSTSNGSYSMTYKPKNGAKYRATIFDGQIKSAVLGVTVNPKLTIKSQTKKAYANHQVTITSKIAPGSSASKVTLLQCNASKGAWKRILSGKPNSSGSVTYRWKIQVGKNYLQTRVIDHNSASGYLRPSSNTITMTGLGQTPPPSKHVSSC